MLVINYNGNKPTTDYFKFSVQGNNKADTIRFLVSLNQSGLVFDENYHIYAKVQSVDDDYYDKVELSEVEFDDSRNLLKADFSLKAQQTSHKQIEVSLSCENLDSEVVWQTQLVKVAIANGVNADEEVADQYPSVLQDLQAQIDELKNSGGGGGSTEVEIKRVYLTYDDRKSILADYLGSTDENDDMCVNDSTRIWVNFETTPINAKMEEEINNDRFIIRLDYPIKCKTAIFKASVIKKHQSTRKNGVGTRGYLYGFGGVFSLKKQALINNLIFITPEDIKTNRYGEKYIHKKITYFDYVNKMCVFNDGEELLPITSEWVNTDIKGQNFFENYIDEVFYGGIPHTIEHGQDICVRDGRAVFNGLFRNKSYSMRASLDISGGQEQKVFTNSVKLNPAFSCYCPFNVHLNEEPTLYSPYFLRKKKQFYHLVDMNYVIVNKRASHYDCGKKVSRFAYMSARPRCAILNDDFENNPQAFLRTYPQSDQQINLYCKVIKDIGGEFGIEYMPIFRMLITQK